MERVEKIEDKKELARRVAQLIEILPPMPENITRLMTARLDSPQDFKQVRSLIDNDPGLCTDLLHLAGDFSLGSNEVVETVDDAVRLIGIQPLVQLIGVAYARYSIRKEFAQLVYLNDYFEHSRDISIACRILAQLCKLPKHDCEMYTVAGLIHDIGRLVIMVAGNRLSVRLMGTSWDKMASVLPDEKQIMGLNHCEVGMQLCKKWNFSPILQEGILRHHTPLENADFSFPGGVIFVSHFVSYSDLTGDILSTMLGTVFLANLNLPITAFAEAQRLFHDRASSHPPDLPDA
jgi:HD-like signal output (HDOD) protein